MTSVADLLRFRGVEYRVTEEAAGLFVISFFLVLDKDCADRSCVIIDDRRCSAFHRAKTGERR